MFVFYFPYELKETQNRPSLNRPLKMLEAFNKKKLNGGLFEIFGKSRDLSIHKFQKYMKKGCGNNVEGVYVESINKPLLLQRIFEKKINIFGDYFFFWHCKKNNIPLVIFYRDALWVTPQFKKIVPFYAVLPLKLLFYIEFKLFEYLFDVFFLPSKEMATSLPLGHDRILIDELFPAIDMKKYKDVEQTREFSDDLILLYVGNISPEYYDITPIVKLLQSNSQLKLNLCCRKEDWEENNEYYDIKWMNNITVRHLEYHELESVYRKSDIHIMLYNVDNYREIAVPFKFYESLQFSTPVITNRGTKVASLVNEMGVGWVVDQSEDTNKLLDKIASDGSLLSNKQNNIKQAISNNTWESRVEKIITVCSEIKNKTY